MEEVDTLVIDKTGTLTEGKPSVTRVVAIGDGYSEEALLRFAASVERASEHPLAEAIVRAAESRNIEIAPVTEFDSPTGKGALGTVEGRKVLLGNARFLQEHGVDTDAAAKDAEALRHDGATAIFIAIDSKAAGIVAIADAVKPSTPEALAALKAEGLHW